MNLAEFMKDDIAINPRAMKTIAYELSGNSESRLTLLKAFAQNDKNGLIALAQAYVAIGEHELAETTFLQAIAETPDRIAVSNTMEWLVERLHATGRIKEAIEIADYCREVGSAVGIRTRALLAEKMGDLTLAERILGELAERYDDRSDLQELWSRRHEEFHHQAFPNGPVPVDEAALPKPPEFGIQVLTDSERTTPGGLRENMIIVSVDGFRVTSYKEYTLLRRMRTGNSITLIFWDGLQYRKSDFVTDEERLLGIQLRELQK